MSKPHEEEWDNGRDFEVTVCGPELDRDIDAPREVLARAAPALARALLHADDALRAQGYAVESMARVVIRGALLKAGVRP